MGPGGGGQSMLRLHRSWKVALWGLAAIFVVGLLTNMMYELKTEECTYVSCPAGGVPYYFGGDFIAFSVFGAVLLVGLSFLAPRTAGVGLLIVSAFLASAMALGAARAHALVDLRGVLFGLGASAPWIGAGMAALRVPRELSRPVGRVGMRRAALVLGVLSGLGVLWGVVWIYAVVAMSGGSPEGAASTAYGAILLTWLGVGLTAVLTSLYIPIDPPSATRVFRWLAPVPAFLAGGVSMMIHGTSAASLAELVAMVSLFGILPGLAFAGVAWLADAPTAKAVPVAESDPPRRPPRGPASRP